jgi:molecular chaperone Hsp31 and glyoxalase 3
VGFPEEDANVKQFTTLQIEVLSSLKKLADFITNSFANDSSYAAVFVPGGHGAMIGIQEDKCKTLIGLMIKTCYTITLCHGPGALLSTMIIKIYLMDIRWLYSLRRCG